MRKEVLFAIVAGSLLGLVIALGVWRANLALKPTPKEEAKIVNTAATEQFGLTIASPENLSVSTSTEIEIEGATKAESIVLVSGEEEDSFSNADEKGTFSSQTELIGGINRLKIISFDPKDGTAQEALTIVYSSEFKKFMEVDVSGDEATDEADPIRERVRQKVAEASKRAVAYIGTVTDITESTIQIKNDKDEILQISINADTEFAKVTKDTKKIERKDIAIGDYLVAMGFKNGNAVLEAKRVLVTTKPDDLKLAAVLGKVTKIDKKVVTIVDNNGKQWTANFGKKWDGPDLKNIKVDQKTIIIGTQDANSIAVRTLYPIEETSD